MLEARVGRLENAMKEVKADLREIRADPASPRESVARIEGMLGRTPDAGDMWRMVIGAWIAGASVVMVAFRLMA